jgi:hypothetical protein
MQQVAQARGANREQQRAIFQKAIKFEPLYFAYYQQYAIMLLPKWAGEPGDTEAFADDAYRQIGGKQGAYIYFEIASNLCGSCGDFSADGYSWPRLQEGFAALEELYGLAPLKLNRFAFLAATYGDKAAAAKAFARIGTRKYGVPAPASNPREYGPDWQLLPRMCPRHCLRQRLRRHRAPRLFRCSNLL